MRCSGCQSEVPTDATFCPECGTRLEIACPACGTANAPGHKFCKRCGQALTPGPRAPAPQFASPQAYTPKHLAEKILTSRSALEGERKQVTVLFCDLANSTALAERLGPEGMHTLLNRFFELALGEVHRYEGTINQFLGDGFMALFGAPLAHEDHARRGVLAALGIQRSLKEQGAALGAPEGEAIAVRMGLNTGPVVVGKIGDNFRMDYTAVGDTTHLAARLQQLAELGAIYASETTYQLAEPYVECQRLGEKKFKGKAEPVPVYRLLGVQARPDPGRREIRPIGSPLVGREAEVTALLGCLERLTAGQGGIVGVLGEAGLGKSRLMTEVNRKGAGQDLLWLEGRALSFGQTLSYWPFLEILRRWAAITEEDSETAALAKLERHVHALFPDELAEVLPYLAALLALPVPAELEHRVKYLDGQAMGRQIFRSARRLVDRLARERPVVLVFEDLHWTDQSSTELIEHLFPLVETVPLLLCGVGRPERASPATRLREVARTRYAARYTETALAPLSPPASATLVDNLLGSGPATERLKELILQKTEGNPFFAEEVVRSLIGTGALTWDGAAGQWRVTREVEQLTIPDTLQGVIMARVDRLDEDLKQVLKIAAVIGRTFFYRVLRAIPEAERELDRHLAELEELELIREKRRIPELEYIFKHAVVQEATYESILVERRRQLHRRVGECIETLFADRLEEFYGLLAYHYARAEDWPKAQEYLFKAGDHAGRVAADAEALAHYRQAVVTYERAFGGRWDPLERAVLERKMGEALFRRGDHNQAVEYALRALALLGAPYPSSRRGVRVAIVRQVLQQPAHRLLPALFLRGAKPSPAWTEERSRLYDLMGWVDYFEDPERLVLDALVGLNFSERNGYLLGAVRGYMAVGLICDLIPLSWVANRYHRRALALAEQIRYPLAVGVAYLGPGVHQYFIGQWDRALEHFEHAAEAYREVGALHEAETSRALPFHIYLHRGQLDRALAQAEATLRTGRDGADAQVTAWGLQEMGDVRQVTGPLDDAISHLREAIDLFKAIPDYGGWAETMADLGQSYLRQGNLKLALAVLEEANRLITERRLRTHQVVQPRNGLAEAYLALAEQTTGKEHAVALRRAGRICQQTIKLGGRFRDGLPEAARLQGTYEWLRGRPVPAQKWWRRSLEVAEELGARYDLGRTYLEIGKRTGDRTALERAGTIFAEIGGAIDLAEAQRLLAGGSQHGDVRANSKVPA